MNKAIHLVLSIVTLVCLLAECKDIIHVITSLLLLICMNNLARDNCWSTFLLAFTAFNICGNIEDRITGLLIHYHYIFYARIQNDTNTMIHYWFDILLFFCTKRYLIRMILIGINVIFLGLH